MPASETKLPDRYLSVKEYARLAGVSEKTVHRYLRDGRLPKYQPGGQNCRVGIPLSALDVTARTRSDGSASPATAPDADTTAPPNTASVARKRPLPKPSWLR